MRHRRIRINVKGHKRRKPRSKDKINVKPYTRNLDVDINPSKDVIRANVPTQIMANRSKRSKAADLRSTSKKVYTQLSPTGYRWAEHPNRSDLEGFDTKGAKGKWRPAPGGKPKPKGKKPDIKTSPDDVGSKEKPIRLEGEVRFRRNGNWYYRRYGKWMTTLNYKEIDKLNAIITSRRKAQKKYVKEPWKMTSEEYAEADQDVRRAEKSMDNFMEIFKSSNFQYYFEPSKEALEMARKLENKYLDTLKKSHDRHEKIIKDAIKSGKKLPPKVKEDYRDLEGTQD